MYVYTYTYAYTHTHTHCTSPHPEYELVQSNVIGKITLYCFVFFKCSVIFLKVKYCNISNVLFFLLCFYLVLLLIVLLLFYCHIDVQAQLFCHIVQP